MMLQISAAPPPPARQPGGTPQPDLLDPLLRLAGEVRETRALIVTKHGLDLLCGLIGRGCPAGTALRVGDRPDAGEYDLVVVPDLAELPALDAVTRLARRALAPLGRLVVGVRDGKTAIALARRLRLNGFTALRSTHVAGQMLLRADLRRTA